ncbi:hypothetical protein CRE_31590 [Caenorhabditis remanei]|uniref:Uncharacterized protein n=1 Tax=Caenorhabditis remanei TaxID=31234 RepID=E3NPS2_CAERE|nr:hypothetical protein CRE_31590 [Caenorhabditis remanei]
MRFDFRTVSRICLLLIVVFSIESEASIIHKHKAKVVRVVRGNAEEKTRLADGTKFERFLERDVPPLPIEEEEADDLNDPRIGHLDKDGGIAVPVDSEGRVLKGFEYLLKSIEIDLDDEEISRSRPSGDQYEVSKDSENGKQKDYKPYHNSQDLAPKPEFLPDGQETNGEEYDDMASEPRESLPDIPDLPKVEYSDSGELDEDLKAEDGAGEDDDDTRVAEEDLSDSERRIVGGE